MPLASSSCKARLALTKVEFSMLNGANPVVCAIARDDLDRLVGSASRSKDPLALFEIYRVQIERIASLKFDLGLRCPNGDVFVRSEDLKTLESR